MTWSRQVGLIMHYSFRNLGHDFTFLSILVYVAGFARSRWTGRDKRIGSTLLRRSLMIFKIKMVEVSC